MITVHLAYNSNSIDFPPEDLYKAYEYTVIYNAQNEDKVLPETLLKRYSEVIDTNYSFKGVPVEAANKGYLLTTKLKAKTQDTITDAEDRNFYSEFIFWDNWDYNQKSIGPSKATIYILNKNLSECKNNNWIPLYELDKELKPTTDKNVKNVTISKTPSSLSLRPTNFIGDVIDEKELITTEGPLLVLRDAKHYYRIVFNGSENSSNIFAVGNDLSIYAYRHITEKELAKMVMLQYADAIYNMCGGDKHWNNASTESGAWTIAKDWGTIKYTISNFNIPKLSPYGDFIKLPIKLSVKTESQLRADTRDILGNEDNFTYKISSSTLTIELADDLNPTDPLKNLQTSYTGSFTVSSTGRQNVSITLPSGESITENKNRPIWLPIRMIGDDTSKCGSNNWFYNANNDYAKELGWWN